jgi:hypothetical protein
MYILPQARINASDIRIFDVRIKVKMLVKIINITYPCKHYSKPRLAYL